MYYVCIENDKIISVLNYEPSVPETVSVVEITDDEHNKILENTHKFDISSRQVVVNSEYSLDRIEQEKLNSVEREFLRNTDWKILRHIRQKTLNQTTSLTEEEYLELEQQRADAAGRII